MLNIYKNDVEKIKTICRLIIINILVLLVSIILFEPTMKSDDYDLAMVAYGAIDGNYSSILMYCSVFFSWFLKGLMKLVPFVAWYSVINYFVIFVSITIISIVLYQLSREDSYIIIISLLSFMAYELYIRMTFTKTAGVVITAGLILFLYLIEQSINNIVLWGFAIVWILFGSSIRASVLKVILLVFFSAFIINLLDKDIEHRNKIIISIKLATVVIALLVMGAGISTVDKCIRQSDSTWEKYYVNNSARAELQDYYMPEYSSYPKEYSNIGISENDYIAYKEWAIYTDYDFFSPEKLKEIARIGRTNQSIRELFKGIIKRLLSYYFSETGFYIEILMGLLLAVATEIKRRKKILIISSIVILNIVIYILMALWGRLQHHVDVSVMIASATIIGYYYSKYNCKINKKTIFINLLIALLFGVRFYSSINKASYYGFDISNQKLFYSKNRKIMDVLSADKEHVYVFCALTTTELYDSVFEPFSLIPKGYYSNLAMTNKYFIPTWDSIGKEYEIKNYYKEATNSKLIYFVCLDSNTEWIEVLQAYINEHYCEKSKYELVSKIDSVNIYRFVD